MVVVCYGRVVVRCRGNGVVLVVAVPWRRHCCASGIDAVVVVLWYR